METIKMNRGETQNITVDYAGESSPWDDLSGATVTLTARVALADVLPSWSVAGTVTSTVAWAEVPGYATAGSYYLTLSVVLADGTTDHTPFLLRISDHAYQDGDVLTQAPVYTTATRPTAGVQWHRRFIAVKDVGVAEALHYCRQTAAGAYEWKVVTFDA